MKRHFSPYLPHFRYVWTATARRQEDRVARGTVAAIGGTSVTVKVGDEAMTFGADAKTQVQARGAGTKTRQMEAAGTPGPHLTDVLTVGQSVAVTYRDNAGKPYASLIRTIPAASATSGSVKEADMRSSGTVKAIGPVSTIEGGAGSGASFTQLPLTPTPRSSEMASGRAGREGRKCAFTI